MRIKRRRSLFGVGVGIAGLLWTVIIALRYAGRPPTKLPVPDAISAPAFARKAESSLVNYGFADARKGSKEFVDVFSTCARQYGAQHAIRNLYAGRFSFDLARRVKMLTQPLSLLWGDKTHFPPVKSQSLL